MDTSPVLVVVALSLYFLPFIVAGARRHHATWPIFILTAFGGVTIILWIVALAWAVGPVRRREPLT